jgi:hypothetical protein
MKLRLALMSAVLCTAGPVFAQTQPGTPAAKPAQHAPGVKAEAVEKPAEKLDPAKEAAIRHLMDITQTSKMGDNLNAAITGQVHNFMSRALPQDQLPKFMEEFSQKFNASAPSSDVTDAMVPIYAKNFTMEEIQELTKFYESILGQHVVKVMPEVVRDSQEAGGQIDQKAALATLRGMTTEYPQLKQMLPAEEPTPTSGTAPAPATPAPGTTQAPPKLAPSTTPPQQ